REHLGECQREPRLELRAHVFRHVRHRAERVDAADMHPFFNLLDAERWGNDLAESCFELCRAEVVEVHRWFIQWSGGRPRPPISCERPVAGGGRPSTMISAPVCACGSPRGAVLTLRAGAGAW